MKKKLLTKQILMALAMSAAVCTTGMAEEIIENGILKPLDNNRITGNLVVKNGSKEASIWLTNRNIKNEPVYLQTEKTDNENGDIIINSIKSGIQTNINLNNEKYSEFNVLLDAAGSNIINFTNAAGNGIYVRNDTYPNLICTGAIKLISSEANILKGSGTDTGNHASIFGNGIMTVHSSAIDVILMGRDNYIAGGKNAINSNGFGDISVEAEQVNYIAGGENAINSNGSGDIFVNADQDNYIAGGQNAILANSANIITVTAGQDNHIGQYTEDNQTITSGTAVNAAKGSILILPQII